MATKDTVIKVAPNASEIATRRKHNQTYQRYENAKKEGLSLTCADRPQKGISVELRALDKKKKEAEPVTGNEYMAGLAEWLK